MQKTPATKKIEIVATSAKVNGVKLKNKDGSDLGHLPKKYTRSFLQKLYPKQTERLWQDSKKAKANREDISDAKIRVTSPPLNRDIALSLPLSLKN